MNNLLDFDFTSTIREYDFTGRAMAGMNHVLDSREFRDMSSHAIFEYLSSTMELVSFSDHLKRYLYKKAELDGPFQNIKDETYQKTLRDAFRENGAPISFHKTSKRISATIKSWLTQESVQRDTIFLLGFGLHMPVEDVSMFLTKVITEPDFDFRDPRESIFWFCYKNGKKYRDAEDLLDWYENMTPENPYRKWKWSEFMQQPDFFLLDEHNLKRHLQYLKGSRTLESRTQLRQNEFLDLYKRVQQMIAGIRNDSGHVVDGKTSVILPEEIGPADIEKEICAGIPIVTNGNLRKVSASVLSRHFQGKCMSRQRITGVLGGKIPADRFALLTFLFYLYACDVEPDWPAERCMQFIDEANMILQRCDMMGIYPVNPYECFILMCLLADSPTEVYADVWHLSFENERSAEV